MASDRVTVVFGALFLAALGAGRRALAADFFAVAFLAGAPFFGAAFFAAAFFAAAFFGADALATFFFFAIRGILPGRAPIGARFFFFAALLVFWVPLVVFFVAMEPMVRAKDRRGPRENSACRFRPPLAFGRPADRCARGWSSRSGATSGSG